jgi:hypothetical protein
MPAEQLTGEANPYRLPGSEPPNLREQTFARRLLSFRNNPITISSLYRTQAKGMTRMVIYFVVASVLFAWLPFERRAYFESSWPAP